MIGICIAVLWPRVFHAIEREDLPLTNKSVTFQAWQNTTIPLYLDFYMFNWTNPEDVFRKGAKPKLVEVGPYVFREFHEKVVVSWNENNTVTYRQKRTWQFQPDLSGGRSLSDKITNVNVVALTIAALSDELKDDVAFFAKEIINIFLEKMERKLYITKSVKELLFDGYDDSILELLVNLKDLIHIPLYDKFGWFYPRNSSLTYDGIYNLYTGVDHLEKLGFIAEWNNQNHTRFFSGQCGQVKGSAGDLYPPDIATKDTIDIFAPDICSGITLAKRGQDELVEGLSGPLYVGDRRVFDNGSLYPETACYSPKGLQPAGIRDLSSCKGGAPIFLSFPHFYLGDPMYVNALQGIKPNQSIHEFSIVVEKNTGVVLKVNAKTQINVLLRKIKDLHFTDKLTHTMLPVMWFDQHFIIPTDMANQLKPLVDIAIYSFWIAIGLCAVAMFGLIGGCTFVMRKRCSKAADDSRSVAALVENETAQNEFENSE